MNNIQNKENYICKATETETVADDEMINQKKQKENDIVVRPMNMLDYEDVYEMWLAIKGFSIRNIDDSKEGIEKLLLRNPELSVVALYKNEIVGSILCGYDGRRANFYHVCVKEEFRKRGIASQMSNVVLAKLKKEGIAKVSLVAFRDNAMGNAFWKKEGFVQRIDLNTYDYELNKDNVSSRNKQ